MKWRLTRRHRITIASATATAREPCGILKHLGSAAAEIQRHPCPCFGLVG